MEIEKYLRSNPDRVGVTVRKVTDLFGKAHAKAATLGTAVSAFRSSGLWPINRDVFQEHRFTPSLVYEIQDTTAHNEDEPNLSTTQECSSATWSKQRTKRIYNR